MSLQMSTRDRYGVRFMVALAQNYGKGITLLRDVSRSEDISEKYLGQIIIPLKAGGLIASQRGSHGGYMLARPPESITVKNVVEAIEGKIAPVPCTDECIEPCGRAVNCAVTGVWRKLRDDIERTLSSFTLADLVQKTREACAPVENWVI